MNQNAAILIKAKRKALVDELEISLRGEFELETVRKLADRLSLLTHVEGLLPKRPAPSPWVLPLSIAVVAASGVILAAAVSVGSSAYELDATVDSITFEVAKGSSLISSGGSQPVTSFAAVGHEMGSTRPVAYLQEIRVKEGATVSVSSTNAKGCVQIASRQTRTSEAPAIAMEVLVNYGDAGKEGEEIALPAGSTLSFCRPTPGSDKEKGPDGKIPPFVGKVDSFSTSRLQYKDVAEGKSIRVSSIISGALKIAGISKTVPLTDSDQLAMIDAQAGIFTVGLGSPIRVQFSGKAGDASLLTPGEDGGRRSLAPSVLDYLSKNALIASLFGLFTGLVGSIWAALRYFGYAPR